MKIWMVLGAMAINLVIFVIGSGVVIGGVLLAIDFFTDGKGLCDESSTKQETVLCRTLEN